MNVESLSNLKALAVHIDRASYIAEVELLGPGKGNAMGPDLWNELPIVFGVLSDCDDVRSVIIRGRGPHFTYGLDLPAMMNDLGPTLGAPALAKERTVLHDFIRRLQAAVSAVELCKKPVIAAVSGWCIGGGIDLISACDIRVADASAKFSVREVRIAIVADLGTLQRLPRIVGEGYARHLSLTGEDFDAKKALQMSLVTELFETQEELLRGARKLAAQVAALPPLTVQGVKHVFVEQARQDVERALRYVALYNSAFLQSKDLQEAVMAFMERRQPQFKGE